MYLQDNILRTTTSLSRISDSMYLFFDNLVWLSKVGIIKIDEKRYSKLANTYWLYSSLLLLTKNLYQLKILYENRLTRLQNVIRTKSDESLIEQLTQLIQYNKALTLDLLMNLCDVFICLNSLKKFQISSYKIGLLGLLSSLISLYKYKAIKLH